LQTTTNLGRTPVWSDVVSLTLTNTAGSFNWTNPGDASRFFRVVSP
jgi:hypothetical protein